MDAHEESQKPTTRVVGRHEARARDFMALCSIEGDVTIGHGAVLHPGCVISAQPGASIVIGPCTVIEELSVVRSTHGVLSVGEHCLLQVGCR
jgi:carbonic anhydrase/acetyltransferase-like protein (isoleucine patch superfamily)